MPPNAPFDRYLKGDEAALALPLREQPRRQHFGAGGAQMFSHGEKRRHECRARMSVHVPVHVVEIERMAGDAVGERGIGRGGRLARGRRQAVFGQRVEPRRGRPCGGGIRSMIAASSSSMPMPDLPL